MPSKTSKSQAAELLTTAQRALACMVLDNENAIAGKTPHPLSKMLNYGKLIREATDLFSEQSYDEVISVLTKT